MSVKSGGYLPLHFAAPQISSTSVNNFLLLVAVPVTRAISAFMAPAQLLPHETNPFIDHSKAGVRKHDLGKN